jgi:predicted metalloprotease with PDZ domain
MGFFQSRGNRIVPEVAPVEHKVVVKKLSKNRKELGLYFKNKGEGLIINKITELRAQMYGFKLGDQLIAVDGVEVCNIAGLKQEWKGGAKAMGDGTVVFTVMRIPKDGWSIFA